MIAFDGWLLDLFEDEKEGIVLYFMDRKGPRWRLTTPFPVTFYAQGAPEQLRALWRYLRGLPQVSKIDRTERMDVSEGSGCPFWQPRSKTPSHSAD